MSADLHHIEEQRANAEAQRAEPHRNANIEPTPEQQEIARLKAELAQVEAEREADRQAAATAEAARQAQQRPANNVPSVGAQAAQRNKVIAACGGMAKFMQLSADARLQALGHKPATAAELAEVGDYVGPKSTAAKAMQLQRSNPAKYFRYRAIAREHMNF